MYILRKTGNWNKTKKRLPVDLSNQKCADITK